MNIHISKMTGKLKGIKAINTNTLTNKFCIAKHNSKKENSICNSCYSFAMLQTFRKKCTEKFEYNSNLLSTKLIPSENLPFINEQIFRFSAHGELINMLHLINLMNLVNKNKGCTFTLWTKKDNLVNSYLKGNKKPSNLILVYSNEIIDTIAKLPKNFDKTFNNVSKDTKLFGWLKINCFQNCIDCRLCYSHNKTEIIIEKVK